jgi:hypothetical protein
MLPKGAAALLVKKMLILCERAAASPVKRYSNVTQGVAAFLVKEMLSYVREWPPLL